MQCPKGSSCKLNIIPAVWQMYIPHSMDELQESKCSVCLDPLITTLRGFSGQCEFLTMTVNAPPSVTYRLRKMCDTQLPLVRRCTDHLHQTSSAVPRGSVPLQRKVARRIPGLVPSMGRRNARIPEIKPESSQNPMLNPTMKMGRSEQQL